MNKIIFIVALVGIAAVAFFGFNAYIYNEKQIGGEFSPDYKDATYIIEDRAITLTAGKSVVQDDATTISTTYFGNHAEGDFDGDGVSDIAFILTQNTGGSGFFYYVVVGLKKDSGYVGTNGVFLGDRIAPQTTEFRDGVIIVNYVDRNPGEPMVAIPSVGISKYLKIMDGKLIEITQ